MSDDLQDLQNSIINRKKPARIHDDSVCNTSTLNPAPLSSPERVEEPEADQSPFTVMVDDNYHYMDGDSRYTAGKFDSWEEALALAEKIVDETVIPAINDGLCPEEAISSYSPLRRGSVDHRQWRGAGRRILQCLELCRKAGIPTLRFKEPNV